jgi:hypothetical protein
LVSTDATIYLEAILVVIIIVIIVVISFGWYQ